MHTAAQFATEWYGKHSKATESETDNESVQTEPVRARLRL